MESGLRMEKLESSPNWVRSSWEAATDFILGQKNSEAFKYKENKADLSYAVQGLASHHILDTLQLALGLTAALKFVL